MFKHYFKQIEDIEFFPLIGLFIFVIFFILLLIWVYKVNKEYIKTMSELPLQNDDEEDITRSVIKENSGL